VFWGCFHILFDLLLLFSSESDVADFDGRSALLYRFNQKSTSTVKDVISLRFRSHQAEGVLVHGEGQRGDFLTLELQRGKLILHLNLGEWKRRAGHKINENKKRVFFFPPKGIGNC